VNIITKKIALLIIPLLILVVLISGCTSSNTTSTNTGSNYSTSSSSSGGSSSGNVVVKIITNEEWSGSVGADSNTRSIDGTGNHQENMGSADIVSAVIQKETNSTGMLRVQILKDGQVIKEESTTAEYGVVSVSASL
jgi:hypothetical protein